MKKGYIEDGGWGSISLPQEYLNTIKTHIQRIKRYTSVSDFLRRFMDKKLKEFIIEEELKFKKR